MYKAVRKLNFSIISPKCANWWGGTTRSIVDPTVVGAFQKLYCKIDSKKISLRFHEQNYYY